MRYLCSVLILLTFIIPQFSHAADVNAGFVQGLWYSSPEFFAGTPVRIYVALRNNTEHDLTATIRFTDNGKRIGSSEVHALSGRLVEAWVDWTPHMGEHKIVATVSDATLHVIGEGPQSISIAETLAEDTVFIDTDTDADGIGNATDTDDDNDTVSDVDETARGTNPLVPNPITKEITDTEREKDTDTKEHIPEKDIDSATQVSNVASSGGFERFLDESPAASILSNVTDKVDDVKKSLDEHRMERNAEIESRKEAVTSEAPSEAPTGQVGTITRSTIEKEGSLLTSSVAGVRSILESVWTFVLFILSVALGYPALIQFLTLIFIIFMIFMSARRLARRPMT